MTINEFSILRLLEKNQFNKMTQREIAKQSALSLGYANRYLNILLEKKYIEETENKIYQVTELGYSALESYKVDFAILLAAGFGSRLLPLTLETPKPLVKVHGVPMIETIIEGLISSGIKRIYIVVGYKKEQFEYLKDMYKDINLEFIINDDYIIKNNISSVYAARDLLGTGNCYICEADLVIHDKTIFHSYLYQSNYMSKYISGMTGEWGFVIKNNRVSQIVVGGKDMYSMAGISYWKKEDALKIKEAILDAFSKPGHENLYWDEIVDRILSSMEVTIQKVENNQIVEIDNVVELSQLDESYGIYLTGSS